MEIHRAFLLLIGVQIASCNLDHALHHYETLHPLQLEHRIVKRDLSTNAPHIRQIEFDSMGRHFHMYLQRKKHIFSEDFKVVAVDANNRQRDVELGDAHPYEGYLIGEASTSEVHATFEDEHNLAATIATKDDVYIVEPSWRHLPENDSFSMIIYRKSDVKMDDDLGKSFCGFIDPNKEFEDLKYNAQSAADHPDDEIDLDDEHRRMLHRYTKQHGHRTKRETEEKPQALPLVYTPVRTTCQVLLTADYLFYSKMGKKSLLKTSNYLIGLLDRVDAIYRKTDFGNGHIGMGFEIKRILIHEEYTNMAGHYNSKKDQPWDTKQLLEAFSREPSYRRYCLAHLFTYQGFKGGVLGLAYIGSPRTYSVGGICSPDYFKGRSRLYLNTGWSSALNRHGRRLLTQEADLVTTHGHNWGSEHDPDTDDCSPSAFKGGKYIMYTYSVSGYDPNNKIFSPCSKRSINAVLSNKAQTCFSVRGAAFCGNWRVEGDEQCDAGVQDKNHTDKCCNEHCQLKPGAQCSDMNDFCCTNCKFTPKDTLCHEDFQEVASCVGEAYCTGNSAECPKPEPKADNTSCLLQGQCRDGKCVAFCETKKMVSCICDTLENSCKWCCKKDNTSSCEPYVDEAGDNMTMTLPNGMPCLQGSCNEGKCEKHVEDLVQRIWKIIENITPDQLVAFMRANIVGTVIVLSLILWIPVSCLVSWKDRKKKREEKEMQGWLRADNNSLFRLQDGQRVRHAKGNLQRQNLQGRTHSPYYQAPLATDF